MLTVATRTFTLIILAAAPIAPIFVLLFLFFCRLSTELEATTSCSHARRLITPYEEIWIVIESGG